MNQQNLAWVDLLRVVACFLVVLCHCCDPFVAKFNDNYTEFLSGAFWGSMLRPCVPLFVMISGVLLLPVKTDMGMFYRKRLSRVVAPLFVWSVVTPILFYLYLNSGIVTVNPHINMDNFTIETVINKIVASPLNFNYDTTPLWYLYMLVGLYLVMPIVSAWLTQASRKDIKRVLWIWLFATTLPYVQLLAPMVGYQGNFGNTGIFGVCDWNPYGTFYYFSGFIGYVIFAYYVQKYPRLWSWSKMLAITIPTFLIGFAISFLGFVLTQEYYPGNFAQLEIVWYFSGVNVLLMTVSIYLIFTKISIKTSALLRKLASLTFGVYLCHFLIVQICYDFIYPHVEIAPYLLIPLIAVAAFSISGAVVWLLSKLPKSKYYIG